MDITNLFLKMYKAITGVIFENKVIGGISDSDKKDIKSRLHMPLDALGRLAEYLKPAVACIAEVGEGLMTFPIGAEVIVGEGPIVVSD